MFSKEDFRRILEKNFDVIREEFLKDTGIQLDQLFIESLGDVTPGTYTKNTYITSNYIDRKIGVLTHCFKQVYVSFSIKFKEYNKILISPILSYNTNQGGSNGTAITDKYGNWLLTYFHITDDEKLVRHNLEQLLMDGMSRMIISHSDQQKKEYVNLPSINDFNYFKFRVIDDIKRSRNIKSIKIEVVQNNKWVTKRLSKSFKEEINDLIQNS